MRLAYFCEKSMVFKCNENSIISLSANNNKVFLTFTSIYKHNLLGLKSLKNNYQQM